MCAVSIALVLSYMLVAGIKRFFSLSLFLFALRLSHASVCPLKTPCVRSKRPRVYRHHAHMLTHVCAWCPYTRGLFERTHGDVFEWRGFFSVSHHTPPHHNNTRHHTETETERERREDKRGETRQDEREEKIKRSREDEREEERGEQMKKDREER